MSIYSKQLKAADTLEDLTVAVKEAITALRGQNMPDDEAYALVYVLRREFSYVVRDLGEGVPGAALTLAALKKLNRDY